MVVGTDTKKFGYGTDKIRARYRENSGTIPVHSDTIRVKFGYGTGKIRVRYGKSSGALRKNSGTDKIRVRYREKFGYDTGNGPWYKQLFCEISLLIKTSLFFLD